MVSIPIGKQPLLSFRSGFSFLKGWIFKIFSGSGFSRGWIRNLEGLDSGFGAKQFKWLILTSDGVFLVLSLMGAWAGGGGGGVNYVLSTLFCF